MVSFRTLSLAASALLMAAPGASAQSNGTAYVTEVVTAYTTYCPGPTTIMNGGKTITVTKATTLTITDCPCTITRPVTPTGNKPPMPIYTAAAVLAVPSIPAGSLAAGLAGVLALAAAL